MKFTLLESSTTTLAKSYDLVGGSIQKASSANMTSGCATTTELADLSELNDFIKQLSPKQAISSGVFPVPKCKIAVKQKANPKNGVFSRSLDYMTLPKTEYFQVLDNDPNDKGVTFDTAQGYFDYIVKLMPELRDAELLVVPSSSAGIRYNGEKIKPVNGWHAYLRVSQEVTLLQLRNAFNNVCWAAQGPRTKPTGNHAFIDFSKSGAMLPRTTFDLAVFSAERLIFEAKPLLLHESITRDDVEHVYQSGDAVTADMLSAYCTTIKTAETSGRIATEKNKAKNKEMSKNIRVAWLEGKIDEAKNKGGDTKAVKDRLEKLATKQVITLDTEIELIGGTVITASTLVDNHAEYDEMAMPDPIEGSSYGLTTAKFYWNGGRPNITSQAHGQVTVYAIEMPVPAPDVIDFVPVALKYKQTGSERSCIKTVADDLALRCDVSNPWTYINQDNIVKAVRSSYWMPSIKAMGILTKAGEHRTFTGDKDCRLALQAEFGQLVDKRGICESSTSSAEDYRILDQVDKALDNIIHLVKSERQVLRVSQEVDMFCDKGSMRFYDGELTIILKHLPFKTGEYNQEIIDDYRLHFPEIDEFLELISAARFTCNRKKAYLWLQCQSDWGKGFISSVLKTLGCVVEMTVPELTKAANGAPLSKQASDFRRCFILFVDEWSKISQDLKMLENEISISAKFQMQMTVPIYTKLFTSADSVQALDSSAGVEDQFANRFSKIDGKGKLADREIHKKYGENAYFQSVVNWVAQFLNELIADFVAAGRSEAARVAERYVNGFHAKYSISKKYDVLSNNVESIAMTCLNDFLQEASELVAHAKDVDGRLVRRNFKTGEVIVRSPKKAVKAWLEKYYTKSDMVTLGSKVGDIIDHISNHVTGSPYPRKGHASRFGVAIVGGLRIKNKE